ncbi:RNA methyltransferase [Flammeovirgaceae bacterium SG7u.111]|nr:RNA methyltransferase [Flammeovirgaceae bacterium SG7u.132]WPO37888.1 RNA methyltransferase [Flammeovirgaceae bacterium SG7u.111]
MNKNQLKLIKSLHLKKNRTKEGLFFVEGRKNVLELVTGSFEMVEIFATREFMDLYGRELRRFACPVTESSQKALESAGTFQSNDQALALVKLPPDTFTAPKYEGGLVLALDDVRDPGNLGTILRIADWYGIKQVICSENTTDLFNPKVINSSMGSFLRVQTVYIDLVSYLENLPSHVRSFGAFMEGDNLHKEKELPADAVLVLGNESNGISPALEKVIGKKITIPSFGGAESLNVATACAVICDNFRQKG